MVDYIPLLNRIKAIVKTDTFAQVNERVIWGNAGYANPTLPRVVINDPIADEANHFVGDHLKAGSNLIRHSITVPIEVVAKNSASMHEVVRLVSSGLEARRGGESANNIMDIQLRGITPVGPEPTKPEQTSMVMDYTFEYEVDTLRG